MNLVISIEDGLSARIQGIMSKFSGAQLAELHHAAGYEVQRLTSDHIVALRRKPGSLASKFGAPPSNYFAQAAEKVASPAALSAEPSGATLTINHPGFIRAFRTVKISPTTAKSLAIPIHPMAFGHRAAELWDRLGLFIPKGKRIIAATLGGVLTPMYLLCRSVTQKQDRTLLPSDEQFRTAALRGTKGWIKMALEKGGKL